VGCQIVAQYARFGDISILLIGFLTFSLLTVFALMSMYFDKQAFEKPVNLVLIVSLACEGFFMGYQAFRVYTPCMFCLVVFGLLVTLGLLRLLYGKKEIIAGFAAMAAVFSLFYLILPAESAVRIPEQKQLVLFYSKECKYCAEVMKKLDENRIPVNHVLVDKYTGFLKSMGIEHVPALYVNNKLEKIFLTGKDEIESYLFSRPKKGEPETTRAKVTVKPGEIAIPSGKSSVAKLKDLLNLHDKSFQIFAPSSERGMCKENEDCK
jgi:glutaredoxin